LIKLRYLIAIIIVMSVGVWAFIDLPFPMNRLRPTIFKTAPFLTIRPEPTNYAWYLRADYRPFGKFIRGIPLREISSSWCFANEFSKDIFKRDAFGASPELQIEFEELQDLGDVGLNFSVAGKFDGSSLMTALGGVFQTCDGRTGAFFLVVQNQQNEKYSKVQLVELVSPPRIVLLHLEDDLSIMLAECMDCEFDGRLRWNAANRSFDWDAEKESDPDHQ